MDFTRIYTDFIQNFEIRGLQVDFMQILLPFTIQGFFKEQKSRQEPESLLYYKCRKLLSIML